MPGLATEDLELLAERNDELNEVLAAGAEAYDLPVALPRLGTLCAPEDPVTGPDLQRVPSRGSATGRS